MTQSIKQLKKERKEVLKTVKGIVERREEEQKRSDEVFNYRLKQSMKSKEGKGKKCNHKWLLVMRVRDDYSPNSMYRCYYCNDTKIVSNSINQTNWEERFDKEFGWAEDGEVTRDLIRQVRTYFESELTKAKEEVIGEIEKAYSLNDSPKLLKREITLYGLKKFLQSLK